MCLFAEGSTTNGTALLKFKKGAFVAMRPVTPCYIQFDKCYVSPTYDTITFWHMLVLMCSYVSCFRTRMTIMPTFSPNDHMLQKFA